METREINVHDDIEFRTAYGIMRAAELYGRERMLFWSEREAAVMFRVPEEGVVWTSFGTFDSTSGSEVMVGSGLMLLTTLDNTDMAFIGVCVAPSLRRKGIGSATLHAIEEHARAAGRTKMIAEVNLPFMDRDQHPYRAFAEKHGYSLANVEVRRILELPVEEAQLTDWMDTAAPHHTDYQIESYIDDVPDERVPSLVHLRNQLTVDAPTGDLEFEAEAMTPESYRERQAKLKEMGRTTFETIAVDANGETVAHTTMAAPADAPEHVLQWGTLVRRDHRGHRLGIAIKAANLRSLQAALPERRWVVTTNGETNGPMVTINELIGFKPVELFTEFLLDLEAPEA